MANPFPGMDPWMEAQWGDAHHRIITHASEQIRASLPLGLRARIEERVFVESDGQRERSRYPDLRVIERVRMSEPREPAANLVHAGTGSAVAEPLVVYLADEPMTQGYIQIIDAKSGGRVVTVIEVLSPSNKLPGQGKRLYLGKQQECQAAGVNLVEIDLLRGGDWVAAVPEDLIPDIHRTPYKVCVWRAIEPLAFQVYPMRLQQRLPAIRIPLREGDQDVAMDLQPLLDHAHEAGDYDDTDYKRDPIPPLQAEEAAWADEILRSKRLR